jgi:hypothetical protein
MSLGMGFSSGNSNERKFSGKMGFSSTKTVNNPVVVNCNCQKENHYDFYHGKKFSKPIVREYRILTAFYCGNYLVLEIQYRGCTNYEGRKILVFKNTNVEQLKKQGSIDPHFGETKNYIWPIARFEPTEKGWNMAKNFVRFLYDDEKKMKKIGWTYNV